MKERFFLIRCLICFLTPLSSYASELSADDIAQRSLERNALGFENAVAKINLVIVKSGSEKIRKVETRSSTKDGLARTWLRFHAPAEVAGTTFLIVQNNGRDDDQFLFLPALGKIKRITATQRNQQFMGTELTYADMQSQQLRASDFQRLTDEVREGISAYVIEATPKNKKESHYARTKSWIHKESFSPVRVEFFDVDNQLLKTLIVKNLQKKDNHWVAMNTLVKNVQSGNETRLLVEDINFDVKLSDEQFTQRALEE